MRRRNSPRTAGPMADDVIINETRRRMPSFERSCSSRWTSSSGGSMLVRLRLRRHSTTRVKAMRTTRAVPTSHAMTSQSRIVSGSTGSPIDSSVGTNVSNGSGYVKYSTSTGGTGSCFTKNANGLVASTGATGSTCGSAARQNKPNGAATIGGVTHFTSTSSQSTIAA